MAIKVIYFISQETLICLVNNEPIAIAHIDSIAIVNLTNSLKALLHTINRPKIINIFEKNAYFKTRIKERGM